MKYSRRNLCFERINYDGTDGNMTEPYLCGRRAWSQRGLQAHRAFLSGHRRGDIASRTLEGAVLVYVSQWRDAHGLVVYGLIRSINYEVVLHIKGEQTPIIL